MTVTTTTSKDEIVGNGTTGPYTFDFKIFESTDIQVYKNGTLLTLITDYTVSINPVTDGGTLTLTVAALNTDNLVFVREMPLTQTVLLPTEDKFPPEQVNNAFDRAVMICQQIQEEIARSFTLPIYAPTTIGLEIPLPVAGLALQWDPTGTFIQNSTYDPDLQVAAAAASATAAANSASAAVTTAAASAASAAAAATSATNAATSATASAASAATATAVASLFTFNSVAGGAPTYTNSSSFSIPWTIMADSTNTVQMSNTTPVTMSLSTFGVVTGICQSANQTGTCSTSSSSTTVTFSGVNPSTIFQIGDVITPSTGTAQRITATSSTTVTLQNATTITAASTYKRGGLAPQTCYHAYMITNGTTTSYVLSTRNVKKGDTLVDLPSGYTGAGCYFGQLSVSHPTDGSSNLVPFIYTGAYPKKPTVLFTNYVSSVAPYNVLLSGTATSFTTLNLGNIVPNSSSIVDLAGITYINSASNNSLTLRATGSSGAHEVGVSSGANFEQVFSISNFPVSSGQQVDYENATSASGANSTLDVRGYTINLVN